MDKKIKRTFLQKNKSKLISSVILFAVVTIIYSYSFNASSIEKVKINDVMTTKVKLGEFQEFITIDGRVLPAKSIFLDAVAGGQVIDIYVEDGDFVKKGDPLLKLNNTTLLLDVMNREAQLFEQENFLRNTLISYEQNRLNLIDRLNQTSFDILRTKRNYTRDMVLYEKNIISEYELNNSKENYEYQLKSEQITMQSFKQDSLFRKEQIKQLESSVKRLQENYKIVKGTLDRLSLTSPMDGQITALNVELGQSIREQERIAQIDILNDYKVEAQIDEHYVSKVERGLSAIGFYKNAEITFTLKKVYPTVVNNKLKIDLEFNDAFPSDLTRGQRIQMKLELGDASESIILKRGAFYSDTGGNWAFVRRVNETIFSKKEIKISRQNPMVFVIESGLNEGDEVIISSYENIKEHLQIELIK